MTPSDKLKRILSDPRLKISQPAAVAIAEGRCAFCMRKEGVLVEAEGTEVRICDACVDHARCMLEEEAAG